MRNANVIRHGRITITEFACTPTPVGEFYWNPGNRNLSLLAGFLGANLGFMAGSALGTATGGPVAALSLLGMLFVSVAASVATLKA